MKRILLLLTILLIISCQPEKKEQEPAVISTEYLKTHVFKLASDAFQGRGAGYEGERKAANYIIESLKASGLDAQLQAFEFYTIGSETPWHKLTAHNVIGILEGHELPDEYVVVGGHYDGQGMTGQVDLGRDIAEDNGHSETATKDTIWNSAVDNAVSIASFMEIARVLKENETLLKRSIIFVGFSAEESGLDGSAYFANNPPVPIKQIKAMVNLEKLVGDPDAEFIYVSYGTNPIFERLQKQTDSLHKMTLSPFYPGMIANTDHYAFGQRRIPAITMGTGSSNNVHTPFDHADSLDYELLKKRTNYIATYITSLVNANSTFDFEGDLSGLLGVLGGEATENEKNQVSFSGNVAFKITSVVKDSKGYAAGLQAGDLIIAVDDQPLQQQSFYQGLEDVIGETTKDSVVLNVIRQNETITLQVGL